MTFTAWRRWGAQTGAAPQDAVSEAFVLRAVVVSGPDGPTTLLDISKLVPLADLDVRSLTLPDRNAYWQPASKG